MNGLFKFSFLLFFMHQIIFGGYQAYSKKMLLADFGIELIKSQSCMEGFLKGTLVQTIHGCVPIEQIKVGDYVLGIEGVQEVLSVKKGIVDQYIKLLMSNGQCVQAATNQDFYLKDETLFPAVTLCAGAQLFNNIYVVDSEIIEEKCSCYSLTTQHHAFLIYPHIRVHNFDLVSMSTLGTFIIGTIEILNTVTILLGAIIPLSVYAIEFFKSSSAFSNHEFKDSNINLPVEKLYLQNSDVLQVTRNYFDIKWRALNDLYQNLAKVKNDLFIFVQPNNFYVFNFSFGLLSESKSIAHNLLRMIPLASEVALNFADKEKLMKMRQDELDLLQQDIFDIHFDLVFHIAELIDRRELAKQQLNEVARQVYEEVVIWNKNINNLPINVAFTHYKTLFIWQEMLDNLEFKTNELKYVMSYYEKLKTHFFMTKTTNFIDVFNKQIIINKGYLEDIGKDRESWFSNIRIKEDFLRGKNSLTYQFVDQCKAIGKQYRAERDECSIVLVLKKKESMKDIIKKRIGKEKK